MAVSCLVPCVRPGNQTGGEPQRDTQKVKSISTSVHAMDHRGGLVENG